MIKPNFSAIGKIIGLFVILSIHARIAYANDQLGEVNHIYQFSVKVGTRTAYLWIPPRCRKVNGVIVALNNMLERRWLEDPILRKTASETNLGIIWIGPAKRGDNVLTSDMLPGMERVFLHMLDDFAKVSGYEEISDTFVIPTGHSANGQFAWKFANALPERTIAAIPVKTMPLPDSLQFHGIPLCYIVGQTTEWPQFRVPDPATQPGDRDFFWPIVRQSALKLRARTPENLISVVVDPGGGHFDWSDKLSRFMAMYIKKACYYRLPREGEHSLRKLKAATGWLTDTGGMEPDKFKAAPYKKFAGNISRSYWFFDEKSAKAAVSFEGDRQIRRKQLLTFSQDGMPLNVGKLGYAALKFAPDADGKTFHVQGDFLKCVPIELLGSGEQLGHAPGEIKFSVINGPAVQIGANTFQVQFSRGNWSDEIWILEEHDGDQQYRRAVQPGKITLPHAACNFTRYMSFDSVPDITLKQRQLTLHAESSTGAPIRYFVESGPAIIIGNLLRITQIPAKTRYPITVTVTAYSEGSLTDQNPESKTRVFHIIKRMQQSSQLQHLRKAKRTIPHLH